MIDHYMKLYNYFIKIQTLAEDVLKESQRAVVYDTPMDTA